MKPRSLALIVGLWLLQRPNEVSARRTEFRGEQERKRELQNLEPPKPAPFAKDVKSAAPKFKISKVKSKGCATRQILNERMRKLPCKLVQVDELWTYVGKHERFLLPEDNAQEMGDQYVFAAMDSESKIIPCFRVGKRSAANAWTFMQELEVRLANRVQLTTDGFRPYGPAVESAFGSGVDYAMLVKVCENDARSAYSPGAVVEARPIPISGNPKPHLISTSHIERQNLTIRMQLKRFARLTIAYSKKLENLKAALALHFAWYNFCRIHSTLRVTPAMACGIENQVWELAELAA